MKKITMLMFVFLVSFSGLFAQTNCLDWNEYVDSKNTLGTGFYTLEGGFEEKSSQTYHYSGPGNVTDVKVNGQIPNGFFGSYKVYLKVSIYNVDANNRPTSLVTPLATKIIKWYYWESSKAVHFSGGGIPVNSNFAVSVELLPLYSGQQFQVQYTGDGEGNNEDLPSTAGTSTGGNWVSLLPVKDGDLYIRPRMNHFITANFTKSATCVATSQTVNFTDQTAMTTDSMFNTISLSGYTGGKTLYNWNFGDGSPVSTLQNPSHSYSTAGVYTVSLTTTLDSWPMGGSFCSDTKTMKVSVGLNVTATSTNLTCNNDNSGSITLSASGGDNSTYLYRLSTTRWQLSSNFSGLAAGTYSIYVNDAMGCIKMGTPVTLTEPPAIIIASPVGITTATCGNSDGAMLASASGGTGALQYSLDNITYQSNGAFNGLPSGTHGLYVKDANGCIKAIRVVLNSTVSPTLTVQSFTNVSCNGGNDGTISLIGSGGTGALQYSIDGINFQSTGNFTSVSAGTYNPTIKDAAGCIGSMVCITSCNIKITEPSSITFNLSQSAALCNGSSNGQIDVLSPIGGTGTLIYSVDGVNFQSGTNFSGLAASLYTVTVKDAANCTVTDTITVTEPNTIIASVASVINLSCFQSFNGSFAVSATGGNGNYSYSVNGVNFFPSGNFNSLTEGSYNITVKDGNNCTGTTSVTLTEPAMITSTITTGNSTCGNANGTILAIAAGGSGTGYTYSIDGGSTSNGTGSFSGLIDSTYLILVTDGSSCQEVFTAIISDSDGPIIAASTSTNVTCNGGNDGSITITSVTGGTGTILYSIDGGAFQASSVLNELSAGQHTVVVKDANSCTGEVTVTLTDPSAFTIVLTGTDVTCYGGNNGSITVAAAGGAGTLAYSIDGINFQSPTTFNNLLSETYTITVRDAGGCTGTNTVTINQPTEIILSAGALNVTCKGGSDGAINANATGGTGTIQYSINGSTYQGTGSFTGLISGNYTVFARDAAGCVVVNNLSVTEPNLLVLSSVVSDVSCAGGDNGVIDIAITGGTTPYIYSWSNLKKSEDVFSLSSGTYAISVVDANGCSLTNNITVTEPLNPIVINGTITDASGATKTNGVIDITVNGGTVPYTFNWSNGDVIEDISSLLPGVYVIIVTDANNCTLTTSFTVDYPVGLTELSNEEGVTIYPNPVKDIINVELEANQLVKRVVLITMTGEAIYDETPNSNKFEVDVKFFATGLYFINIYIGNDIITKKIVINKE